MLNPPLQVTPGPPTADQVASAGLITNVISNRTSPTHTTNATSALTNSSSSSSSSPGATALSSPRSINSLAVGPHAVTVLGPYLVNDSMLLFGIDAVLTDGDEVITHSTWNNIRMAFGLGPEDEEAVVAR